MTTRRHLAILWCAGALAACGPLLCTAPSNAAQYEMEQQDRREEKKRLLEKLRKDRAKIDLAVEATKTLIDRSRTRPYLAELYLRLAELHIEKSRVVYFIRREEVPDGTRSLENLESHALKRDALEIYQRILDNFPEFGHRDRVLFFMAHEYRELGEIDEMLARYREILKSFRQSRYAPEAYLLLGDHFFNTKELDTARRHYEAVLAYPESPAVAVARYKLGWCLINDADWKGAMRLFEQAVATPEADREVEIDTYRKVDIKLESLVDMAYCYTEEYKDSDPEDAVRYFERYAWSRPVLTVVLEKLAHRYYVKKKWQHAAHLYRKLATVRNDPEKLLEYAGRIFECVRSAGAFDRADEDLALIVKALRKLRYSVQVPDDVKERNTRQYELYARDIATHLHQRAREERSLQAFRTAAAAYRLYVDFFDRSDVRDEMNRNLAEALFASRQYLEAGKVYEKSAKTLAQRTKDREENLYGAVLSYYSALKEKDGLTAYGKVYARAGLRATGQEYAKVYPKSDKVPSVLFNVAWVVYDEGKYEAAIQEFTRYVETYPSRPEARAAVHLVLDAYAQRSDYQGLLRCGERFAQNASLDAGLRREVDGILRASRAKVIAPLAVAAARDWTKGKGELLAFAEENRTSALGEQALSIAMASSASAGDLRTLFSTGARLLGGSAGADKTAAVEQPLNLLIDTCVRAGQFRQLAQLLEEFARRLPEKGASAEFLLKAARIREALGQRDLAGADYAALLAKTPRDAPDRQELVHRAADNALRRSDPGQALQLLLAEHKGLKGAKRAWSSAKIAALRLSSGSAAEAEPFVQEAKALEAGTELDSTAREALAELELVRLAPLHKEYAALRLDPATAEESLSRKEDLLASLVGGYEGALQLKAPRWSLLACARAREAYEEFARFLKEAPAPGDFTPAERAEYEEALEERAAEYRAKGQEFLALAADLARKWELCDADLAGALSADGRAPGGFGPSLLEPASDAADRWLQDDRLVAEHSRTLERPTDAEALLRLSRLYLALGDPRQAVLIALKAIEEAADATARQKASLWNTVGVAQLYAGQDPLARDAFQKALASDSTHVAARMNLGGLLRHYGHREKADAHYAELGAAGRPDAAADPIHPHARELFDAAHRQARKN